MTQRVKLFISHSQKDSDLADRLIHLVKECLEVPSGAIRCSSVPGYELELGALLSQTLQRELKDSVRVVALLTPNSLQSPWVLFELGAIWGFDQSPWPLLAGGLGTDDLPGPLRNVVAGHLDKESDLARFVNELNAHLGWPERNMPRAVTEMNRLAAHARQLPVRASETYTAKLNRIGETQNRLLKLVTAAHRAQGSITLQAITDRFDGSCVYYRLEQLHLLGFLDKTKTRNEADRSPFRYALAHGYRTELGLD